MIYLFLCIISLFNSVLLYATSSSTTASEMKQSVNFAGKITTHQGQEYVVDNISIQGKVRQIIMPDKPKKHNEAILNNETKQLEIQLEANPHTDYVKSPKDLDEIQEMSVPSPHILWVYQKKGRSQRLEFIEVQVTTNSGEKSSHLLEPKTPIYCDGIDTAGPQEKIIPLSALKTLTIEGYTYRDTSKTINQKTCTPCNELHNNNPKKQEILPHK